MTVLASSIVVGVEVSSNLIGCVRPAPANGRRCRPGRGGVGKTRELAVGLRYTTVAGGGGGEGRRFSYLLGSHMTYLAGSQASGAGQEYG
jgi:hypothetical protein